MLSPHALLLVLLFLLVLLLPAALCNPLAGTYTLSHGPCAPSLKLLSNDTTIPPTSILLNNTTCTGSTLSLTPTPTTPTSPQTFLAQSSQVSTFYAATANLTCANTTLTGPLTFLTPDKQLTLPAALAPPGLPDGVLLTPENMYVLSPVCIYSRKVDDDPGIVKEILDSIAECLPADALVTTPNRVARVDTLHPHATVKTSSGTSKVLLWTHRDPDAVARFTRMTFMNRSTPLTLTPGHYVFADGLMRPAGSVKRGMIMRGLSGALVVRDVSEVVKRGLYNPHTETGDIFVNGVLVSCYTRAVEPSTAHALLAPVRGAWSGLGDAFGNAFGALVEGVVEGASGIFVR